MNRQFFSLAALTVLELSPPEMVEVAARAGFDGVGLRPIAATPEEPQFPLLRDTTLLRQTLSRLRETGLQVLDVEILRLKPETRVKAEFERFLEVGAQLGASEVLVAGNDDDEQRLVDNFAALCDLAMPFGLHPHLEFMPWTGVKDLLQAQRIVNQVQEAGHENAGLLVDAFHFNRSRSRLEDLAKIPPEWMRYAQLCDVSGPVPHDIQAVIHEARSERHFPGDGDIDLKGLLKVLPDGVPLSLEIPTQRLRERGVSALERAKMALSSAQRLVEQAC